MIKTKWGFGLTGAFVCGAIGIFGLSASGNVPLGLARIVFVERESVPAWVQRIALVDEALGRADLSRATYEWREARGAAPPSGRSEDLIAVGDRALPLPQLGGGSAYFVKGAQDGYLPAALLPPPPPPPPP